MKNLFSDIESVWHKLKNDNKPVVLYGMGDGADKVMDSGFEFLQMGRALLNNPRFVNEMKQGLERCGCDHVNYCIARMYSREMACHKHLENLPRKILKEINDIKRKDGQLG